MSHRLQGSRFELKYIIDEHRARAMIPFIRCHLRPDEHADPRSNYQYAVHSLYLDSPGYTLCNGTCHGHKNRFKLRIRFYDELPQSPVFFEIKRRQDQVILKQRATVQRAGLARLLRGRWPRRTDLRRPDNAEWAALEKFFALRDSIHAQGKVFVSYLRQAFVTPKDDSIRVTFDRALTSRRFDGVFSLQGCQARSLMANKVILELKFTDRFPIWMRELARSFDLEATSMAKYVACLQALPNRQLRLISAHAHRHEGSIA